LRIIKQHWNKDTVIAYSRLLNFLNLKKTKKILRKLFYKHIKVALLKKKIYKNTLKFN
jgi:hypothetical protein